VSDFPRDPGNRESIPLLLARPSRIPVLGRPSAPPPPGGDKAPFRVASSRAEMAGAIGYLRGGLGAAGTLVAALLVLFAIFADLLASDLPIACKMHGRVELFPNVTQPAARWAARASNARPSGRSGRS